MEVIYSYLTDPNTIVSLIIFIFGLGALYSNILTRLKDFENRIQKIEDLDLDSRLTKLQTDMDWVRLTLDKYLKK